MLAYGKNAVQVTRGLLVDLFHNQSDGFREIDDVGGNTGFTTIEPMIKLFWEPDSLLPQRFEFKFGYTYFDADETYLGLESGDLAAAPLRRYVSTQFDNIRSDQFRTSRAIRSSCSRTCGCRRMSITRPFPGIGTSWIRFKTRKAIASTSPPLSPALGLGLEHSAW